MAWYEKIQEWNLSITDEVAVGSSTGWRGDGQRVFIELGTGAALNQPTVSLPEIDDDMVDPAQGTSGFTYTGIKAVKINFTRDELGCNGRTATVEYTSKQVQPIDDDAFLQFDGGLRAVSISAASDWAWYSDNTVVGTGTALQDLAKMYGRVDQDLTFYVSAGSFTKRKTIDLDAMDDWLEDFVKVAGCVNSTSFEGFNVGQVLLETFDASNVNDAAGNAKAQIDIKFLYQIIRDATMGTAGHDDWQFLPLSKYVNNKQWSRPVLVERSDGAGIQSATQFIYPYADFSSIL